AKSRKRIWSVKETDLVLFTRQLATMIEAGISLVQALTALYDQCDPKRQRSLRHVVSDVTTRVQGGETFHESIAKHPRVFNRLFVSMVKAGQSGRLLAAILERLAGFLEASARLRKKIKSAMTYPVAGNSAARQHALKLLRRGCRFFSRFQLCDRVAEFGGALVKLFRDCSFHFPLHDLELGARTFRADFIQPFFQEMDLGAFRSQLGKARLLEKVGDGVAPTPDFSDRLLKFSVLQENRSLGPGVHHQHIGTELLQRPGKLVAFGMSIDEIEEIEIALRVADDAREIVDLKQAEVAVVVLNTFLLKLGALFRFELVSLAAGPCARGAELMISEQRFATVGPHAVRPAGYLHLQNTEIDPELQFLPPIQAKDFAHFDGAVLVRPIL